MIIQCSMAIEKSKAAIHASGGPRSLGPLVKGNSLGVCFYGVGIFWEESHCRVDVFCNDGKKPRRWQLSVLYPMRPFHEKGQ